MRREVANLVSYVLLLGGNRGLTTIAETVSEVGVNAIMVRQSIAFPDSWEVPPRHPL